jgi:hypothetical protein
MHKLVINVTFLPHDIPSILYFFLKNRAQYATYKELHSFSSSIGKVQVKKSAVIGEIIHTFCEHCSFCLSFRYSTLPKLSSVSSFSFLPYVNSSIPIICMCLHMHKTVILSCFSSTSQFFIPYSHCLAHFSTQKWQPLVLSAIEPAIPSFSHPCSTVSPF